MKRLSEKLEIANDYSRDILGPLSDFNLVGKVLMGPAVLAFYSIVWVLTFLFVKERP